MNTMNIMKKILALALALTLALSLAACGGSGGNGGSGGSASPPSASGGSGQGGSAADSGGSKGGGAAHAGTASELYGAYVTAKSDAYSRASDKINEDSELALSVGMQLLGVALVDLTLLPLTIVGSPGGAGALAMLGIQDANVAQNGQEYIITYTNSEGEHITQTCEFDAGTGSIKSDIKRDGEEILYFELVQAGAYYASQYSSNDADGTYSLITCFCGADIAAFGITNVSSEPPSIYKNNGITADFVKNDELYLIMQNDQLTIVNNGETKTY